MNLTRRQLDVLLTIADYRREYGISPTQQEVANSLGLTKVTVCGHVESLVAKGALNRTPVYARTMTLTPAGEALVEDKVMGEIDQAIEDVSLTWALGGDVDAELEKLRALVNTRAGQPATTAPKGGA